MPNKTTSNLQQIDDLGYEVNATVTGNGAVMEAVDRKTGERFTALKSGWLIRLIFGKWDGSLIFEYGASSAEMFIIVLLQPSHRRIEGEVTACTLSSWLRRGTSYNYRQHVSS